MALSLQESNGVVAQGDSVPEVVPSSEQAPGTPSEQRQEQPGPSCETAPAHVEQHRAFPLDVFQPKIRKFICEAAASRQCLIDFVALPVLAVAAAAIGATRAIRQESDWVDLPGIYGALVGRPGSAKTPAINAVVRPLEAIQKRYIDQYREAIRDFDEATRSFRAARPEGNGDIDADPPVAPARPAPMQHVLTTDPTIDALAANLEINPRGILIFKDELSRLLMTGGGQIRGRERLFFLSCWSNKMTKRDLKSAPNEPTYLERPLVGILGGIQPDLLRTLQLHNTDDDGLMSRFLFCWPERQRFPSCTDTKLSEQSELNWNDMVNRLHRLEFDNTAAEPNRPIELCLDDDAKNVRRVFFEKLQAYVETQNMSPSLEATCLKMRTYFGRFALVLRLLRAAESESHPRTRELIRQHQISPPRVLIRVLVPREQRETANLEGVRVVRSEDAAGAERLCWYFIGQAARVHHAGETQRDDEQIARLVVWLTRRGCTSCTARDVVRAELPGVNSTAAAKTLLSRAVDRGVGYWEKAIGRQRTDTFILRVSPAGNADTNPMADA